MPPLLLNCLFLTLIVAYASRAEASPLVAAFSIAAVKAVFVYAITRNLVLAASLALIFFVLALMLSLLFRRSHKVSARGWGLTAIGLLSLAMIFGESIAFHHLR
jgi:hypothetical protein